LTAIKGLFHKFVLRCVYFLSKLILGFRGDFIEIAVSHCDLEKVLGCSFYNNHYSILCVHLKN